MDAENIVLKGTRLIFRTNFSGDPARDKFGDTRRKANIVVPEDLVESLRRLDCNVKQTKPRWNRSPEHYVQVQVRYGGRRPVNIFLVKDGDAKALNESTVGILDTIRTGPVDAVLKPWMTRNGRVVLFADVMYVSEQEDKPTVDPFYDKYRHKENEVSAEEISQETPVPEEHEEPNEPDDSAEDIPTDVHGFIDAGFIDDDTELPF